MNVPAYDPQRDHTRPRPASGGEAAPADVLLANVPVLLEAQSEQPAAGQGRAVEVDEPRRRGRAVRRFAALAAAAAAAGLAWAAWPRVRDAWQMPR